MAALIILFACMLPSICRSQDCNEPVQFAANVNFKSDFTAEMKVGLWYNDFIPFLTVFGGYLSDNMVKAPDGKGFANGYASTGESLFFETGVKVKPTPWLYFHPLAGFNRDVLYAGIEALYIHPKNAVIAGVGYKNKAAYLSIYMRF